MKTKFFKNFITALLIIFAFTQVIFLSSCKIEEVNLVSMELIEGSPTDFVIGEFDYSKYSFLITYKDGTTKNIVLTEEMLSSEDYLKTYRDGTHTLTAKYLNMSCPFTVTAKRYTFPSDLKLQNSVVTYDGKAHGLEVVGALPEGTTVTFPDGNEYVDASDKPYIVNAILVNSLYVTTSISGELTINKAVYDMSGIEFNDVEYDYDGNPKSIYVTGNISQELDITYSINKAETNTMIDASATPYEVVAHFDAGGNYLPIPDKTAYMTINKAKYDMSGVSFENKTYVYDGNTKTVRIGNLTAVPKGVVVQYSNNEQKTVGVYTAVASFVGDTTNYEPIPDMTATLEIVKAKVNLSGINMENESYIYDRAPHFASYTGSLPAGVTFLKYEYYTIDENDKELEKVDAIIDVGRYHVKALFLYVDKTNYEEIDPLVGTVEITKADIDDAVFEDISIEYDGFSHSIYVSNLPDGVVVTYTNNAQKEVGTYTVGARFEFITGSTADKNYNIPSPMNATMSITKATMGRNFDDISLEYSGENYNYKVADYLGNNSSYLGKQIVITCGTTELENSRIYEYLPQGVSVYYTVVDPSTKVETMFDGSINPGESFIYVNYYADTLEIANSCYSHYNIDTPTKVKVNIGGVEKDVYLLARKYLIFNIAKKEYTPSFVNQITEYDGNNVTVLIDVTEDQNKYPNLSFESGYETTAGIYENNINKLAGIYSGSVKIMLSSDASKYYTVPEEYEFIYVIKNQNGKTMYNPEIDDLISEDYTLSKSTYRLPDKTDVPKGIKVEYIYSSDIVKPGSYAVKVSISFESDNDPNTFTYGDAAKAYYRLPTTYVEGADGAYSKVITYTINHMLYTPSFVTEYYFQGLDKPIVIEGIDLPTWVETTYYDESNNLINFTINSENDVAIIKPGTYHITAKLRITDTEKAKYYEVDENGTSFDITVNKSHYSAYKIVGEKVKYDGELHDIVVTDLPEGITYTTSIQPGRREVGTYKDVIIYFSGENECYEPLDNVKLNMVIENSVVSLGNLEAYVKTTGTKNVKQFSTLKDLLKSYVDLTGADLVWSLDYYKNSVIYPQTYINRHGNSESMNDFVFTESTGDDEFALCTFTINLKYGYVFDNSSSSTVYSGSLYFNVSNTTKVGLGTLNNLSNDNEVHVSQNTILDNLIYGSAPKELNGSFEIVSWNIDYYYALNIYPTDHVKAHANSATYVNNETSNKFAFELNTWGDRYCKVEYTIKVLGDYCIYINGQSYQTYTGSFKCLVDENVNKIDDHFINKVISNNEFNVEKLKTFNEYLDKIIDTTYVDIEKTLYKADDTLITLVNNDITLDENVNKVTLKITCKDGVSFIENAETKVELTKANVVLDNSTRIDVKGAFIILRGKSDSGNFTLEQYIQPGKDIIGTIPQLQDVIAGSNMCFVITYNDGTILRGFNQQEISIVKLTEENETAKCHWIITAKDGYYFTNEYKYILKCSNEDCNHEFYEEAKFVTISSENQNIANVGKKCPYCNEIIESGFTIVKELDEVFTTRFDTYEFDVYFKVQEVNIVNTAELSRYASEVQEVQQYTNIEKSIHSYLEEIKGFIGDDAKLSYKWSIAYYNGLVKEEIGNPITDSTSALDWISMHNTSENEMLTLTITLSSPVGSGFVFDNLDKEITFVINYKVNERTLFTDSTITSLNGKTEIVSKSTTLQNLINKFNLNSNLSLDTWTVTYDQNVTKSGNAENVFIFSDTKTYHVTLNFVPKTGTCLYLNETYYNNYSIEIDVKSMVIHTSTIKLSDVSYATGASYIGTPYENTIHVLGTTAGTYDYEHEFFNSLFDNFDSFKDLREFKIDSGSYGTLDNSSAFTTTGIFTYTYKLSLKDNTETDLYKLVDIYGEEVEPNSNNEFIFTMDIEVTAPKAIDTTAYDPITYYSYESLFNSTGMVNGHAISEYICSGVCENTSILWLELGGEPLTETEWNNPNFIGTLPFGSSTYEMKFKLRANIGYAFKAGDTYVKEKEISVYANIQVEVYDSPLVWAENVLPTTLQKFIKYDGCLIGASNTANKLPTYEHYSGIAHSYTVSKYSLSGIKDNTYVYSTDGMNDKNVIYKVDYTFTSNVGYTTTDNIWLQHKYYGTLYIYSVEIKPTTESTPSNINKYSDWGYVTPNTNLGYFASNVQSGYTTLNLIQYNYSTDPENTTTTNKPNTGLIPDRKPNCYIFTDITFVKNFDPTKPFNEWITSASNYYRLQNKVDGKNRYSYGWVVAIY